MTFEGARLLVNILGVMCRIYTILRVSFSPVSTTLDRNGFKESQSSQCIRIAAAGHWALKWYSGHQRSHGNSFSQCLLQPQEELDLGNFGPSSKRPILRVCTLKYKRDAKLYWQNGNNCTTRYIDIKCTPGMTSGTRH